LSAITEILDRLSAIEVLKEKLRDTGSRVRIETLADLAQATRRARRKLK